MFLSIRSRLWVSYILLVGFFMCGVTTALAVSLSRSPILYRQTISRLRLADAILTERLTDFQGSLKPRMEEFIGKEAAARDISILILDKDRKIVYQAGSVKAEKFPLASLVITDSNDLSKLDTFRDKNRSMWIYSMSSINRDYYLVLAVPRPKLAIRTILNDTFITPFIAMAAAGLFFTFIIAVMMANWIVGPLQRIATASAQVAAGKNQPLPMEGPLEVQQLANSFNQMSQQVQDSQRSQKAFLANVSHELKTPLTSIQGFAQAILDGAAQTPEALGNAARVIYSEADRMNHMVLDLLTLAKLEAGAIDLQKNPVDLSSLVQAAQLRFEPMAHKAGVSIRLEQLDGLPSVSGDGDRLAQVINNLVDNAIKFTPAGGTIVMRGVQDQNWVMLKVIDSGSGISTEDQKRIFDRFYQVDRSRKGGGSRGIGLGLSIARQIVLAHRGDLTVTSNPGGGSIFTMSLPVSDPNHPPRPAHR